MFPCRYKVSCNRRNNIRSYSQIFETGIDKDIALCLYTAIVTDTGVSAIPIPPENIKNRSELLKYDIDFAVVIKKALKQFHLPNLS